MFTQLDSLIKSIESYVDELEKMAPMAAAALRGAAVGAVTGAVKGAVGSKAKKSDDAAKSSKENSAYFFDDHAGAKGAPAPKPAKAPKENTIDYGKFNKPPKAKDSAVAEASAPAIQYSPTEAPKRVAGSSDNEAGFKVPKEKKKILTNPDFRSKLADQRKRAGFTKSEEFGKITETLTKSIRSQHSDGEISEMLKAAVDANQLHTNVLIEWINYRTINPAVMGLVEYEDEA